MVVHLYYLIRVLLSHMFSMVVHHYCLIRVLLSHMCLPIFLLGLIWCQFHVCFYNWRRILIYGSGLSIRSCCFFQVWYLGRLDHFWNGRLWHYLVYGFAFCKTMTLLMQGIPDLSGNVLVVITTSKLSSIFGLRYWLIEGVCTICLAFEKIVSSHLPLILYS